MTDLHTTHSTRAQANGQAAPHSRRTSDASSVDEVRAVGQRIAEAARAEDTLKALKLMRTPEQFEAFLASVDRLVSEDLVVAILGLQGIGKSSLINAILGRRVLPVDEVETTNVPCRILGAGAKGERVEVSFSDGRTKTGPVNSEFIGQYSDEERNPENQLGVSQLSVYLDSPLLQGGVQLVDTPGVGSLTEHTAKATMDFLSKVSVGIFVVSSSPTLRDTEARFLSAIYRHVRQFIFVQNSWSSDLPGDVADGLEDNLRKLQEIARRHSGPEVELLSVDVHTALEGATNDMPALEDESGLSELRRRIAARLADGAATMLVRTEGTTLGAHASDALERARLRSAHLEATGAQAAEEHAKACASKEAELQEIEAGWREKAEEFGSDVERLLSVYQERVDADMKQVRATVVPLIQRRELSGEAIGEAVQEHVSVRLEAAMEALQDGFQERAEGLELAARDYAERSRFHAGPTGRPDADAADSEFWEGVGSAGQWVGGAGVGILAGEALWAAGAALFAGEGLVAAGSLLIPGVGIIVAALVLFGGMWVRSAARKKAIRKIVAKVDEYLEHVRKESPVKIREAVEQQRDRVVDALTVLMDRELAAQRALMERITADYQRSDGERAAEASRLRRHAQTLSAFLGQIEAALSKLGDTHETAAAAPKGQ